MKIKGVILNKLGPIAIIVMLILTAISLGHSSGVPQHLDANGSSLIGNSEDTNSNGYNCTNCSKFQSNATELGSASDKFALTGGLPGPQGAWKWQNPLPQGNALLALDAIGDSIWVAGLTEAVYRSVDRGATWNATDVDVYQDIVDLAFADEQNGWIVANIANIDQGLGAIRSTDDGGATWSNPIYFTVDSINCIYFDNDSSRLWVGGSYGFVAYSDDYGKNFKEVSIPGDPIIEQLVFVDENTGFALTMNKLYFTQDAGKKWEVLHKWDSSINLNAMAARAGGATQSQLICVVGTEGFAQMSQDGKDWTDIDIKTNANLNSVALYGPQAFIAGDSGTAFRTEMVNGNIWEKVAIPTSSRLYKAKYYGIDDILVSGDCGVLMLSQDGGVTWMRLGSGINAYLNDIALRDPENGWAVGTNGAILHTNDGKTWSEQRSSTTNDLNSVSFVSYLNGWAVGAKGCIITTSDGGQTWLKQRSGETRDLLDVLFIDRNNGWAVGSGGLILHTANGGRSWQRQTSHIGTNLKAVSFVDDNFGWTVGDDGAILRTTDGGKTWNAIAITAGDFNDVHFVDSKYGWICGTTHYLLDGNVGYRTEDGGETWIREVIPIDASFKVDFVDRSHGWQVGMFGHIIATDDGGRTWRVMPDASPDCWLTSIDMIDEKTGYVAGGCGAILRTDTGGEPAQ